VFYVDGKVLSFDDKLIFKDPDGREVARVSKKWFSVSDSYAIDIDAGENDVLILAAAVVIDLVSHPDKTSG